MNDDNITDTSSAASDKFEHHYRQQLSALMDGALPPDEARFLLRRLQHDTDLAQCLDRWHMAGDALRGESQAIVCDGFAERVAAMVASEPASIPAAVGASRANRSGLRWAGGAALAASVALVALFVTRQPSAPDAMPTPSSVAEASIPADVDNASVATNSPSPPSMTSPAIVAETIPAAAIATASAPSQNNIRRGNRSQSQRATIRTPARSQRQMVAGVTPQGEATATSPVFDTAATARPWPGAVFPQMPAAGSFNVGYGGVPSTSASSPTFYPFEPRLPEARGPEQTQQPEDAPLP
ncbi:MAG: sigma-E factor negative regulatory protein [Pseudomonadota bacterium]|nr:sigma-E factor negative regulatory protein [Pseudomonadota bacterium]MDQ3228577.1 sigma-E factor negative regulatory protein [Pseudomonadota bacterium]